MTITTCDICGARIHANIVIRVEVSEGGLRTTALLGLGLYVIETRSRNRNKDLGPWKPSVAFEDECNADQYLHQYGGTGYFRIIRPNVLAETPKERP